MAIINWGYTPFLDIPTCTSMYLRMEATGSVRSACAYLECKIVSRMDAADHWVGYAEVLGGDVASSSATAAVHHRKVGTYY